MVDRITPNRQAIRQYVANELALIKEASDRGDNVDQLILDLSDEFERQIFEYSDEERQWLATVRREESEAAVEHNNRILLGELERTERQIASDTKAGEVIGAIIAFLVVVGIFWLFFIEEVIAYLFQPFTLSLTAPETGARNPSVDHSPSFCLNHI
ncbi:MAG: hypothetical protein K2P86_06755 [Xanthobacteraceae bacterium]|nr:hypothetical protein [Xanthobacteraceae bacterium]